MVALLVNVERNFGLFSQLDMHTHNCHCRTQSQAM